MPITVAVKFVEKIGSDPMLRFRVDIYQRGLTTTTTPATIVAPNLLLIRTKPNGKGGVSIVNGPMFVTESDGAGTYKRIAGDAKAKQVTFQPTAAPDQGPTTLRWRVYLEVGAGTSILSVRDVATGADVTTPLMLGVQTTQVNTAKPSAQAMGGPGFPRLSVGINTTPQTDPAPPPGALDLGDVPSIKYVTDLILKRLRTPRVEDMGDSRPDALAEVWDSEKAPLGAMPQKIPDNNKAGYAQEIWARQISEMLLVTLYGGPGVLHLFDGVGDTPLIGDSFGGTGSNKCYPLSFACQHLSSAGIASRGPSLLRGKQLNLVNAGHATASTVVGMGGQWVIGTPGPTLATNLTPPSALAPTDAAHDAPLIFDVTTQKLGGCTFEPPAVFVFSNRLAKNNVTLKPSDPKNPKSPPAKDGFQTVGNLETQFTAGRVVGTWGLIAGKQGGPPADTLMDNTAGAHIGFVLRVDPATKKYQTFDTGGLGGSSAPQSLFPTTDAFHGGNFDFGAVTTIHGLDPYRGCGVFPPMNDADANALVKHVDTVLKKLRPLGFARLYLVPRGAGINLKNVSQLRNNGLVLYASPFLRMWAGDDEMGDPHAAKAGDADRQNFSIARYLWSLRMMPGRDAVEPMWFIYAARGLLARAMMNGARTDKLAALAQTAFAGITKNQAKFLLKGTNTVNVPKVVAEFTLLTHILTGNADGTVGVKFKFNAKETKLPPALTFAERPSWDGSIQFPCDKSFLQGGKSDTGFADYLTKP